MRGNSALASQHSRTAEQQSHETLWVPVGRSRTPWNCNSNSALRKKAEPTNGLTAGELRRMGGPLNIQRRIGVFYNYKLAVRICLFQMFVETSVEISAAEIVILAVRFAVRQQRRIQNDKTGMRCFVLAAKLQKTEVNAA
jgi:hypothetical protein